MPNHENLSTGSRFQMRDFPQLSCFLFYWKFYFVWNQNSRHTYLKWLAILGSPPYCKLDLVKMYCGCLKVVCNNVILAAQHWYFTPYPVMITDFTTQMHGIFYTILDHDHSLYSLDVKLHLSNKQEGFCCFCRSVGQFILRRASLADFFLASQKLSCCRLSIVCKISIVHVAH